ncbi:GDSL-like Lipase/Acylhydrolase [Seminavis robusta]|uniref:GDSL-like Lipase/Acylhydrolase n=1 Tax=Seminavis robusta TaxID=568900 RepID=A0A9N8E3R9_9STRA|nr:GDSL-like Lipase/Acylhydrolase [Seminavis robusta]|eukprot:Sro514_g158150.1 GDSL-like Lipase/Acylhydrolase (422) ;mRNA; r:51258-52523
MTIRSDSTSTGSTEDLHDISLDGAEKGETTTPSARLDERKGSDSEQPSSVKPTRRSLRKHFFFFLMGIGLGAFVAKFLLELKIDRGTTHQTEAQEDKEANQDNNRTLLTAKTSPELLKAFNHMIIFGDSFSDTGNIYAASNQTAPASPPYYQGRYSNGLNYADFLAERLGKEEGFIQNYACGGATTDSNVISAESTFLQGPVPAVNEQIQTFTADQAESSSLLNSNSTLYILYSGYNDYWWWMYRHSENATGSSLLPSEAAMERFAEQVSSAVVGNIVNLYEDSRVSGRHFLVADLAPMKHFPEATNYTSEYLEAYHFLTQRHNALLEEKLDLFQKERFGLEDDEVATIQRLKIHDLYMSLLRNPTENGFSPTTTNMVDTKACLSGDIQCALPFGNLFWDDYHPTTHTHFLISQEIVNTYQ